MWKYSRLMPDSPVDHSLASEAAAGASAGSIPRSCNIFNSFFFGLLIIHERIQRYIIACNELIDYFVVIKR